MPKNAIITIRVSNTEKATLDAVATKLITAEASSVNQVYRKHMLLLGQMNKKSAASCSCPNCGALVSHKTLISRDNMEPGAEPGNYTWTEKHRCQQCETEYTIDNGTQ